MGKKRHKEGSQKRLDSISLKETMGCIVVLGFLTVFIIMAVRLPPDNLLEVFRTAASPLAIVIVALFGASKPKDGKDNKS